MAAGVTFKPKRKAGAFSGGELAAGEVGLDTTNGVWYYSGDGSTVSALGGGGGGGSSAQVAVLPSDVSIASGTAWADITGLGFSVEANKVYRLYVVGHYNTGATGDGMALSVNGPASPDALIVHTQIRGSGVTTQFTDAHIAYDNGSPSTLGAGPSTSAPFQLICVIETGANAGTLIPRFRSEAGNSVTILGGSYAIFDELTE